MTVSLRNFFHSSLMLCFLFSDDDEVCSSSSLLEMQFDLWSIHVQSWHGSISLDNGGLRKMVDEVVSWLHFLPCPNKKF